MAFWRAKPLEKPQISGFPFWKIPDPVAHCSRSTVAVIRIQRFTRPGKRLPKKNGKSLCFMGKSPCFMGKSPFFMGKSLCFMGKSPFFMGKSPFLMGKSTIYIAIDDFFPFRSSNFNCRREKNVYPRLRPTDGPCWIKIHPVVCGDVSDCPLWWSP